MVKIGLKEFNDDDLENLEVKAVHALEVQAEVDEKLPPLVDMILKRWSTFYKAKRMLCWLNRYATFCINRYLKSILVPTGPLTLEEMKLAEKEVVQKVQEAVYSREIEMLKSDDNARLLRNSSILKLSPVLEDGLLLVGGRLDNADVSYEAKHQAILPGRHRLTELIIRECHEGNGHVGLQQVISQLRQKYWIMQVTAAVRSVLHRCFSCRRRNQAPCNQKMAALPAARLMAGVAPFENIGVDYFGPMFVTQGRSQVKRWGCLFTCLTTRAVHLEVAHTLDTESFLAALARFESRRGRPAKIFSDNGTNFTSADKELRSMVQAWNQRHIQEKLLQKEIEWNFIPPSASHMGGVWERIVKSVKRILLAVVKEVNVQDEALTTAMCLVERILNDRPITPNSSDESDPAPLTPNQLLLLRRNPSTAPSEFDQRSHYYKRRYKQANLMADIFWSRWLTEYLPLLQERSKWYNIERNLCVGDVVLICEDNCPRGQWPMAIVEEVHASQDQLVRSVRLRSGHRELVRPISKLCLLEESQ